MPTEPTTAVDLPAETSDSAFDALMNNEQTQVTSPDVPAEASSESSAAPLANDMTFDLDSLTSDLAPQSVNAVAAAPAAVAPQAESTPIASVTLPAAGIVQPAAQKSSKKKALAMAAAFIMLLVVGGFVFKTMMPEESDKLLASVLGTAETAEEPTPVVIPEMPADQEPEETEEVIDEMPEPTLEDEGAVMIETPAGEEITEIADEQPEEETTMPETPATTMSLDQAKTLLSLISQNSKRALSEALKLEEKQASALLYKVFKDSANLLETLANTQDISTIENVEEQISSLQKTLNQATAILNVASNSAQSE